MADLKISQLTAAGALTGAELVEAVQGGLNVKTTTQAIANLGGGGSGDVVGPASATDSVPVLFDGTTGKLVKNSTPTGTGNPVLATAPTLTNPVVGTQSQGDNSAKAASTAYTDLAVSAKYDYLVTLRTETASDILDATDLANVNAGDHLVRQQNVGTANDLEIPLNATVAFPIGTTISVRNIGVGVVTITGAIGVTLASPLSFFDLTNQYDMCYIEKVATNTWYVNGELS